MHGVAMLLGLLVSGHCRVLMCRRRDSYSSFQAFCNDWGFGVACFVPKGFWQELLIVALFVIPSIAAVICSFVIIEDAQCQ
jgi:hypothetical protein